MKILFIGDIVGSVGREVVRTHLPFLKERYELDLVIANGENAAHGKGITAKIYRQLVNMGIDMITMGNHTFAKNDLLTFIDSADHLVRPANLEPRRYGKATRVLTLKGKKIAVSNVCGEVFMNGVIRWTPTFIWWIFMEKRPVKRSPLPMHLPVRWRLWWERTRMCRPLMNG